MVPMRDFEIVGASHAPQGRARHSVRAVLATRTRGAQRTDAPYPTQVYGSTVIAMRNGALEDTEETKSMRAISISGSGFTHELR